MKHTQEEFKCVDCNKTVRKGTILPALAYIELCPQCYTKRQMGIKERDKLIMEAANGMPTEEAVKYITHGREMADALRYAIPILSPYNHTTTRTPDKACHLIREALNKLEAK